MLRSNQRLLIKKENFASGDEMLPWHKLPTTNGLLYSETSLFSSSFFDSFLCLFHQFYYSQDVYFYVTCKIP